MLCNYSFSPFDTKQGIGSLEEFWGYFTPDLLHWGM